MGSRHRAKPAASFLPSSSSSGGRKQKARLFSHNDRGRFSKADFRDPTIEEKEMRGKMHPADRANEKTTRE